MLGHIFTHWKSSLLGLGLGVLNAMANGHSWKQALISTGLTLFGFVVPDADKVTGR